jgi:hypothetical protein
MFRRIIHQPTIGESQNFFEIKPVSFQKFLIFHDVFSLSVTLGGLSEQNKKFKRGLINIGMKKGRFKL